MSAGDVGIQRVLLVGFMGCGKSSVGRELARELGWSFRDFDDAVESETGKTIPDIFRTRGEPFFRRIEERVGQRLLEETKMVLASGGGWAAAPDRLESLPPGTLSVWLRVSAEEAVRRTTGHGIERPLLDTDDPVGRARALLDEREPFYDRAELILDSETASPRKLAQTIADYIRVSDAERSVTHANNG